MGNLISKFLTALQEEWWLVILIVPGCAGHQLAHLWVPLLSRGGMGVGVKWDK